MRALQFTEGQDSYRLAQATAGKGVKPLNARGTHKVRRFGGRQWGEIMAASGEK